MTPEAKRYDQGLWLLERLSLNRLRRKLLQDAQGTVLELGVGTGANLPFYDHAAQVVAIDLNWARLMGAVARANSRDVRTPAVVACADAQRLPLPDNSFDTVVSTLVFCSIPDPMRALAEVRRVLRPGGRLLLLEHVRGQGPISRRLTDWLHPLWFALQGECHLNRETAATVDAAGFHVTGVSTHGGGLIQLIRAL